MISPSRDKFKLTPRRMAKVTSLPHADELTERDWTGSWVPKSALSFSTPRPASPRFPPPDQSFSTKDLRQLSLCVMLYLLFNVRSYFGLPPTVAPSPSAFSDTVGY